MMMTKLKSLKKMMTMLKTPKMLAAILEGLRDVGDSWEAEVS